MTPTPKAASTARTGPSTTDSDAQPVDEDAAAPAPAPAPADDGSGSDSDSDSSSEIPLCDAPVVKKRKVETVATSRVVMTDSERYKRDDAGCAERLKKREADQLLPCHDPDDVDDQGVGARFQGYDGFTIGGPPVFR